MEKGNVLLVLTSESPKIFPSWKSGYFWPEYAHAFLHLYDSGFSLTLCSLTGNAVVDEVSIPHDAAGDRHNDEESGRLWFDKNHPAHSALLNIKSFDEVASNELNFSGIFFVGGHAALWDFPGPRSAAIHTLATMIYQSGGCIGAVCHGPSVLSSIELSPGEKLIKGVRVTGYSIEAETLIGTAHVLTAQHGLTLTSTLLESGGALYECNRADPLGSYVVSDKRIITGQNPASASATMTAFIEALHSSGVKSSS